MIMRESCQILLTLVHNAIFNQWDSTTPPPYQRPQNKIIDQSQLSQLLNNLIPDNKYKLMIKYLDPKLQVLLVSIPFHLPKNLKVYFNIKICLLLIPKQNLVFSVIDSLSMVYPLELQSILFPKTDYLTSLNKLKKEEKLYQPLIHIRNLCPGTVITCNLVRRLIERHSQMKFRKYLN